MARFDAVLFDAGGVLVLPDPYVLGPLFEYYGGDPSVELHRRGHYAGMKARSDIDADEQSWDSYGQAYLRIIGVADRFIDEANEAFHHTLSPWLWRWTIPETRVALDSLADKDVPMGVVSNASGQIHDVLVREICQIGPGPHVEMRCIVDSHVVGVAKPDPAIFDHALPHFDEFDRARIAYVGDSVTMDIAAASAAGLHPILIDPYDDHAGADFERIRAVAELVTMTGV